MKAEDKKKADQVLSFFKESWCIDGAASFVSEREKREILSGAEINLIRLTDSERGIFYIARIIPKP